MRFRKDIVIETGDLVKWGWEIRSKKVGVILYACHTGLKTVVLWNDGSIQTFSYTTQLLQVISKGSPEEGNNP